MISLFRTTYSDKLQEPQSDETKLDVDNHGNSSNPRFNLGLEEVVSAISQDEKILRWNPVSSWFEVVNGFLFKQQFNALRCIRGKRNDQAMDRPFARMHVYFDLVRGDKWAGTGSAFRPKQFSNFQYLSSSQKRLGNPPSDTYFAATKPPAQIRLDELCTTSEDGCMERSLQPCELSTPYLEKNLFQDESLHFSKRAKYASAATLSIGVSTRHPPSAFRICVTPVLP